MSGYRIGQYELYRGSECWTVSIPDRGPRFAIFDCKTRDEAVRFMQQQHAQDLADAARATLKEGAA